MESNAAPRGWASVATSRIQAILGAQVDAVSMEAQAYEAAMASLRMLADERGVAWDEVERALDAEAVTPDAIRRVHNRITKRGSPWPSPETVRDAWHWIHGIPLADRPGPWVFASIGIGIDLLWALALEIDERGATRTGESVCLACGGWGEVAAIGERQPGAHWAFDPRGDVLMRPISEQSMRERLATIRRMSRTMGIVVTDRGDELRIDVPIRVVPCPCDGPTRPETVSLHRLVADLAAMKSPRLASLPDLWHVQHDQREAAGDRSWQHQWWRAFMAWTLAGQEPDAEALAPLLRRLTDARRERPQPTRRYASQREMEDDGFLPTDTGGLGGGFDPNAWVEAAARNAATGFGGMAAAIGERLSPTFRRLSDEMRRFTAQPDDMPDAAPSWTRGDSRWRPVRTSTIPRPEIMDDAAISQAVGARARVEQGAVMASETRESRMQESLISGLFGRPASMREILLAVPGVTSVVALSNQTDFDSGDIPARTTVLVWDGDIRVRAQVEAELAGAPYGTHHVAVHADDWTGSLR